MLPELPDTSDVAVAMCAVLELVLVLQVTSALCMMA